MASLPLLLESNYFGTLEYSPDSVFEFPAGLPGFETERGFAAIDIPGQRPILYLQSLSRPDLCLLTLPARSIARDYELHLAPEDLDALGFAHDARPAIGRDVLCLAVTVVDQRGELAVNLLAPIVVNLLTRRAAQVVQEGWSLYHPLAGAGIGPC